MVAIVPPDPEPRRARIRIRTRGIGEPWRASAVRGHRIEAAREDDPGARLDGRLVVRLDHLLHPGRLAGEIDVVGAVGGARGDDTRAVPLVRAHRGAQHPGGGGHGIDRGLVIAVSHDDIHVVAQAQFGVHRIELGPTATGDGPASTVVTVAEVLAHQPTRVPRGAEHHHVVRSIPGHGGSSVIAHRQQVRVTLAYYGRRPPRTNRTEAGPHGQWWEKSPV
jgi:hypothetical protein